MVPLQKSNSRLYMQDTEQGDVSLKRQRESDEEEDGAYSSSDDSVEFILAPRPGSGTAIMNPILPPEQIVNAPTGQPGLRQPEPAQTAKAPKPKVPGVDVDAVAQIDGQPITQIDLNQFEDKPWRKPGADITDYFNYGFDEFTWTAYCSKQDYMRTTYTPQKMMAQMGMPPMFMPGMMPPGMKMPGMP